MSNKLKKITARAKQLKKKHPGAKWTNLIKQASRDLKSGKTKNPNPKKTKKRKRATSAVAKVAKVSTVRKVAAKRTRKKVSYKTTHKVRRVGAAPKSKLMMPLLLIGGGLLAWALLKKKTATVPNQPTYTAYRYTGDTNRDTTADAIIKYAQAAGYAADAIAKLIAALNTSSTGDIEDLKDTIEQTNQIPSNWV